MDKLKYEPPRAPRLASLSNTVAVRPAHAQEVTECVREANTDEIALRPLGGGRHVRSLPDDDELILDLRSLNGVLDWDAESLLVEVEAGITVRKLTDYVSRRSGSLSSWRREHPNATVGGLLSTYQPIPRGLWNGSIREVCLGLECVTPTGEEYCYVRSPRKAAGPDLRFLYIGAEGRFGVITGAWVGVAPTAELAKFYSVQLDDPGKALEFVAAAWAAGLRIPNALYSGASGALWLLMEGSRDFVSVMEGILLDMAQLHSASLLPSDPADYYEPSQGDVRAGADPVTERCEDAEGGIAIWGNLRTLPALPAELWHNAILYDISPHQASVLLPASVEHELLPRQLRGARSLWFDGHQILASPAAGVLTMKTIASVMDPGSVFGAHGGEG